MKRTRKKKESSVARDLSFFGTVESAVRKDEAVELTIKDEGEQLFVGLITSDSAQHYYAGRRVVLTLSPEEEA